MELLLPQTGLIFWTIFSILLLLFPILALVSILNSTFKDKTNKMLWVLIILFMPFIGPMLYFIIGRNQRLQIA
ncbi:MAG: PLD nuclease N-terminal domain-containing protein [Ginsengibacter sp.]